MFDWMKRGPKPEKPERIRRVRPCHCGGTGFAPVNGQEWDNAAFCTNCGAMFDLYRCVEPRVYSEYLEKQQ